jgi:hypothetical protein
MGRRENSMVSGVGLRRVAWVQVMVDEHGEYTRAEAHGIGHRLPSTVPIPLSAAAALAAAGVPVLVRHVVGAPA